MMTSPSSKSLPRILAAVSLFALSAAIPAKSQTPTAYTTRIGTGGGYSGNNVNSVSYRTDPLATHGNAQYSAYYDTNKRLVLAKRTVGSTTWTTVNTGYTAAIEDSHRTISLAVDGDDYLHVSWCHHAEPLKYIRSLQPGSLQMSGLLNVDGNLKHQHTKLTYPEFFNLPDGNLLFTYRLGGSGDGDTYIQRYNRSTQSWSLLHNPTIKGTATSVNAYPNGMVLDQAGDLHWTWCWRDSASGTAANHDQLYARSSDFGTTWKKMNGTAYSLPITEANADLAWAIPTNSDIANQCHMAVDLNDRPMIAQRWDPDGSGSGLGPRLILTWHNGSNWNINHITAGIGWTRPLVVVDRYNRVLVFYSEVGTPGNHILKCAYTPNPGDRSTWNSISLMGAYFLGGDIVFDRKRYEYGDGRINIYYQNSISGSVNVREWDGLTPEREPMADTHVRTGVHANTNFGANEVLEVKLNGGGSPDYTREAYLRFDVSGLANANSIRLRLVPVSLGSEGPITTLEFSYVSSDSWSELGTTWNSKPSSSAILGTKTGFVAGQPFEVDVTAAAVQEASNGSDGLLSVRIRSLDAGAQRSVNLGSRESSNFNYLPVLVYD